MESKPRVVYLEDLDAPVHSKETDENKAIDASSVSVTKPVDEQSKVTPRTEAKTETKTVKRQRTLMDMFSSSNANTEQSSSKRQKLTVRGSSSFSGALVVSSSSPSASASGQSGTKAVSAATNWGLQPLNAIPFSLSAYVGSLTDDQKRLLKLECDSMGKSWLKLLKDEIKKPYFISLKEFLWQEGVKSPDDSIKSLKVYPSLPTLLFYPPKLESGSLSQKYLCLVKLHPAGKGQSCDSRTRSLSRGESSARLVGSPSPFLCLPGNVHSPRSPGLSPRPCPTYPGLCFSVPAGVAVPPSLRNVLSSIFLHAIYAEIKAEYPDFSPPKHGNLIAWAQNGVLMLNTCLTVRAGDAGSHSNKGWEQFTDKVVDVVDRYGGATLPNAATGKPTGHGRGVVFLAWGAWAAKRVAKLDKHPSPFSANKGFLGNGHFKKANDWLEGRYGTDGCVDWCNLDPAPSAV
ncbi:hypothetical protein EW146_g1413 [Bondarzewia mesenterica]|uniref:Uracil-DNA glycosylase-like domain-containing protein n=1 Tax=Bondarzewia mesenterica TaxID=1095465 RepID=A0A4S4M4B7_9AGAM|nr:hypothetical protein EW146_g1413 [Bondarzewia mesenterica]